MELGPFVKSTLGELMLSNITQAAQIAELTQKLAVTIAENEKMKEEIAEIKPKTKQGAAK